MSCIFCKNYAGIGLYCLQAHFVETTHESIMCDDYEYNQSLGAEE